jgi:hypothetical protein
VEATEDSPSGAEVELFGEEGVVVVEAAAEVADEAAEAGDKHRPPVYEKCTLIYYQKIV